MKQHDQLQVVGYSLFEMLISLSLMALLLTLLMTTAFQTASMWHEWEEEEVLITEGSTLMKMICRDLQSASLCSEKLAIDIPLPSCQKNLFFLRRTPSEDLVTIGYFLDPNKKHHCYRFFAPSNETLAARCKGHLTELEAHASPNDAHSIILSKHLLSWEITPIWNKDNKLILLEINLAFGKTIPRYFLSTVVRLPPS